MSITSRPQQRRPACAIAIAAALALALPSTADAAQIVFPDGDVAREGLGDAGTTVQWTAPRLEVSEGTVSGTPTCTPASGSAFPTGTTEVECRAAARVCPPLRLCFVQLVAGRFTVTVTRGSGPVLSGIADRSATADSGRDSAAVDYPLPAASDPSGVAAGSVRCTPAPASQFAVGDTTVTCSARDVVGNESSATFRVTVFGSPSAPSVPEVPSAPSPDAPPAPDAPAAEAPRVARAVALGRRLRISRGGVARLAVTCPADNPVTCQGALRLETARTIAIKSGARKRKLRLGRANFALTPGQQSTARIRLGRAARRVLAGRGRLRLRAVATTSDQAGGRLTGARTFTVRVPRR